MSFFQRQFSKVSALAFAAGLMLTTETAAAQQGDKAPDNDNNNKISIVDEAAFDFISRKAKRAQERETRREENEPYFIARLSLGVNEEMTRPQGLGDLLGKDWLFYPRDDNAEAVFEGRKDSFFYKFIFAGQTPNTQGKDFFHPDDRGVRLHELSFSVSPNYGRTNIKCGVLPRGGSFYIPGHTVSFNQSPLMADETLFLLSPRAGTGCNFKHIQFLKGQKAVDKDIYIESSFTTSWNFDKVRKTYRQGRDGVIRVFSDEMYIGTGEGPRPSLFARIGAGGKLKRDGFWAAGTTFGYVPAGKERDLDFTDLIKRYVNDPDNREELLNVIQNESADYIAEFLSDEGNLRSALQSETVQGALAEKFPALSNLTEDEAVNLIRANPDIVVNGLTENPEIILGYLQDNIDITESFINNVPELKSSVFKGIPFFGKELADSGYVGGYFHIHRDFRRGYSLDTLFELAHFRSMSNVKGLHTTVGALYVQASKVFHIKKHPVGVHLDTGMNADSRGFLSFSTGGGFHTACPATKKARDNFSCSMAFAAGYDRYVAGIFDRGNGVSLMFNVKAHFGIATPAAKTDLIKGWNVTQWHQPHVPELPKEKNGRHGP